MTVTTPRPAVPIGRKARQALGLPDACYDKRGRFTMNGPRDARVLASRYAEIYPGEAPSPSDLYGAAHIITAWRLLMSHFASEKEPYEQGALKALEEKISREETDAVLDGIMKSFPDDAVWHGRRTPGESIRRSGPRRSGREWTVKNWTLINLAVSDPAFAPFGRLFDEYGEKRNPIAPEAWNIVVSDDKSNPPRVPEDLPPVASLRRPIDIAPNSVKDQLLYILSRWGRVLGDWAAGLIGALDMIEEETRPRFHGPGPAQRPGFADLDEYARFSRDDDWMPRVVLMAKNVLVWLDQLSRRYQRPIRTLDAIPEEELSLLASRGFNALWLIGLWERSAASREIKRRMGNPEAHASAYSLFGYEIAGELGGWEALERLRDNAERYGIRLSSDMVPNHVGIDSDWVRQYPHRLLAVENCPFPGYRFESENLSADSRVDIRLEDHYWERTDAAVVFKRTENATGRVDYVYHGNDGTTMPWNDTAQIDFLNPEAREAVIEDILHVARNFPIIRFDAAMVLARKHIRRLWYPAPGAGGAIPSRSEHALSDEEFLASCPTEFWREVVDRVAAEVPGTLLLAEAFWMMEGYFVRTLGMHRVYNSAFMNMLRDKKNAEYRDLIKETIVFDPGILQRFVNFMNNPDEETAVEQFGKDDRYFAACTLLATLPGLPMVGHGQVEGLSEKYGMEYVRAYRDEHPDDDLIARHEREIFPLLSRRHVFAGAESFRLYDLIGDHGVNEDVFAFSNASGSERSLVLVNNAFERAAGSIRKAAAVDDDLASALGIGNTPGRCLAAPEGTCFGSLVHSSHQRTSRSRT
jgi:glycosidase